RALQGGYRDKVHLATKLPYWEVETAADFDRIFHEQLARLQSERLDFYLLHSLSEKPWHKLRDLGVLEWLERRLAEGRVGHVGFSFHDSFPVFQEIIDSFDRWTFCQIQYNYMDVEEQAGTKGLQYAAARGLAVVVMEPLLGGRLVKPPAAVQALWDGAPAQRTPADWALQWLWSQPEVSVVLSGMSAMLQVQENIASASNPHALTAAELDLIARVRAQYQALMPIHCTQCEYCQPCPNGLKIPRLFDLYNGGIMYNTLDEARRTYRRIPAEEQADACAQCRQCEDICPQHIEICAWLERVHEQLST
ncbi:MAG TPA: aldo/keto reductase, partial [Anaerolineae bacterium]|nr:aldo/keto reductase [Anaerolineae bacterium]